MLPNWCSVAQVIVGAGGLETAMRIGYEDTDRLRRCGYLNNLSVCA